MELDTATPEAAPVEATPPDALAAFLAEDDTSTSEPEGVGDGEQPPATEGEAQTAEGQTEETLPVEEPRYKVKVRGEEVEVPLNELLNGYSRTEDYKAKTAEVAELRRQAATEYADKLEQQVEAFARLDPILSQTANLDWAALAQQDPATFVALKAQYDQRVEMLQSAVGEIQGIRQQNEQRQNEALAEYHQREREALLAAVPELKEPAKLEGFARGIAEYLKSNGFDDETIRDTADHRAWLIADKARRWDELQKAKATVGEKKAPPKPGPALKPQATEQSPRAPKRPGPNASDDEKRAWVLSRLDAE